MESELKDLNPNSNSNSNQQQSLDPIDEASSKDDRPLLKPDDSAPLSPPPISAANIEELEKKFTAFVRNDVYGTMGRGELPWTEKVLLGIAFLTLVPIRVVLAMTILVFYYLICRICTLFSSPNREEEQEDYAHLGGWRRAVIVRSGRFLSRVMLFVLGFYWIKETNRSPDIDGKLNTETDVKDQSEEPERPGAIISNHISHLDILYHMSSFFPSFVAKRSVAKLPLVGLISKCLGCIYVQRESKSSDFKGVSGVVNERVQEAYRNKFAPMMMLFPEGTTTNGDFLLPFKTGAFLSKAPVRPVILRYPYQRFSPAWDSISGVRHVIFLFCQFVNYLEVTRLPVYYPSQQEKDDPKLYANNVRRLMAREVLLMTIQNAPPGLDSDRDKKFSKSFKEMVAMCLVKDQTKRPTAEKLLKHSFFKQAKPPELSVKKLFADLPPLWNRVEALQRKDAAQLALKKMPSAEQEAISQSEYQRGVSAWNFDIEDLKVQASLVQDDDEIQEIREEYESMKPVFNYKKASNSRFSVGKSISTNDIICSEQTSDEFSSAECLSNKGKVSESDLLESDYQGKIDLEKNGSRTELLPSTSEKDIVLAKIKTSASKSRQTQSGPLMPGIVLNHSVTERGHIFERCDHENQPLVEKPHHEVRKAPSFSGPLKLPNRASANSLSAPIKSSGGFRDSLEDKSKTNLVQIKGRFSVTSENVDLVKDIPLCTVPRLSSQGSPLRKSASVGDWIFESKQMPIGQLPKEMYNSNLPASILMPHLQNLFHQTSIQQDLIMNLLSSLQPAELADASQNGKLLPLPHSSENNGIVESAVSEREHLLLIKISELQARMITLTSELTSEKLKFIQLQQQLNAVSGREEDGDRRDENA